MSVGPVKPPIIPIGLMRAIPPLLLDRKRLLLAGMLYMPLPLNGKKARPGTILYNLPLRTPH